MESLAESRFRKQVKDFEAKIAARDERYQKLVEASTELVNLLDDLELSGELRRKALKDIKRLLHEINAGDC